MSTRADRKNFHNHTAVSEHFRRKSGECPERLTRTFAFSPTAPLENFRRISSQCKSESCMRVMFALTTLLSAPTSHSYLYPQVIYPPQHVTAAPCCTETLKAQHVAISIINEMCFIVSDLFNRLSYPPPTPHFHCSGIKSSTDSCQWLNAHHISMF